jgi:hypothetical protein
MRAHTKTHYEFRQLGPVSEFMINSYCESLKDTFAQMVYYGILKEEDAQCFSVRSAVEPESFVLACRRSVVGTGQHICDEGHCSILP